MKTQRSAIGIVVLLALALSAFASASASAADRAFLCEPVATGATFVDQHCLVGQAGGSGWKHTLPSAGSNAITVTNNHTAAGTTASSTAVLKGHIAGMEAEITCTTISGSGSLTNGVTAVSGTGSLEYSGCTMTKPAERGCRVDESGVEGTNGVIKTKELKGTTVGTTGTRVKIEPVTGTELARVPIEGCLNNTPPTATYPVAGSLEVPASGATLVVGHGEVTTQGTLLFAGGLAGYEGATTINASSSGSAVTLTP